MRRELLGLLGDPDANAEAARLRLARSALLAYGALRGWVWLVLAGGAQLPLVPGFSAAVLQTLAFVLALRGGTAWLAPRLALPALLLQLGLTFPQTNNHFYLELLCVALLCVVRRDDAAGDRLVLRALRAVAAIVLFHTGLQKLLYGHYLHGDFLAYMIGRGDRFAAAFRVLLSPGEIARLAGYNPFFDGAGPYRVENTLFVAVANLVWIAELLLPLGLVWRRTRTLAAALAIALVLTIQLGAREIGFAVLFCGLLALSLPLPAPLRRRMSAEPEADARGVSRGARRWVIALLVWLAVWPLAHRAAVAHWALNPWKFAGFAMYTTPIVPEVVVLFEKQGSGLAVLDERTLPKPARDALQRFRDRRTAYGTLASGDDLARAVFDARPDLAWLVLATQRLRLDPTSARMTSEREQKIYERAEVERR